MADNAEWLTKLNYIEFLRDVGRHFSVNRMLSFDSVKLRLDREQELSFLEFNYMILQAYDFVELNRATAACCRWAARTSGATSSTASISAAASATPQLYAADLPAAHHRRPAPRWARPPPAPSGSMPTCCSPYDYWQFWRNTEDADVGRFLKLFTILPLDEIARLEALPGAEINEAKKVLATEATALLHGRAARRNCRRDRAKNLRAGRACRKLPTVEITAGLLDAGLGVLTAFGPEYAKLVPSSTRGAPAGEGRRPARQRPGRLRRARHPSRFGSHGRRASSSSPSARRSTCCCGRSEWAPPSSP